MNASFLSKLNQSKQSMIIAVPVIISAVLCYKLHLQNHGNLESLSTTAMFSSAINLASISATDNLSLNDQDFNYETEVVVNANIDSKTLDPLQKNNSNGILHKIKNLHEINNKDVQKFMKEYKVLHKTLPHRTKDANPHFRYIIDQLQKKKMPLELALLPVVESNYKPNAVSCKGAAGIWQIMPKTGKHLGLKKKGKYDGRKDIKASTKAALNYLEYLHDKFNQDWMLALAAYNAGEGTVSKAIEMNIKHGKPTSFWHLKLPMETRNYVPKFIAITRVAKAS